MKIIDCFTFFNELDLLEIRLNELDDVVDYFVLVEASKTQSMNAKSFYFDENRDRYSKFLDKIIHIKIENYPNFNSSWDMENYQRDCISNGLAILSENNLIEDSDIVMVSDLDEIPSKNSVSVVKEAKSDTGSIDLDFFVYFMNFKTNRTWRGPAYCTFEKIRSGVYSPQKLRNIRMSLPLLTEPQCSGWHFGWMGGFERLYTKLFSCIEPLDKSKIPPFDEYVTLMKNSIMNKTFYNIDYSPNSETFITVTLENQVYPQYLVDNMSKFKEYFYV